MFGTTHVPLRNILCMLLQVSKQRTLGFTTPNEWSHLLNLFLVPDTEEWALLIFSMQRSSNRWVKSRYYVLNNSGLWKGTSVDAGKDEGHTRRVHNIKQLTHRKGTKHQLAILWPQLNHLSSILALSKAMLSFYKSTMLPWSKLTAYLSGSTRVKLRSH